MCFRWTTDFAIHVSLTCGAAISTLRTPTISGSNVRYHILRTLIISQRQVCVKSHHAPRDTPKARHCHFSAAFRFLSHFFAPFLQAPNSNGAADLPRRLLLASWRPCALGHQAACWQVVWLCGRATERAYHVAPHDVCRWGSGQHMIWREVAAWGKWRELEITRIGPTRERRSVLRIQRNCLGQYRHRPCGPRWARSPDRIRDLVSPG